MDVLSIDSQFHIGFIKPFPVVGMDQLSPIGHGGLYHRAGQLEFPHLADWIAEDAGLHITIIDKIVRAVLQGIVERL